MPPIQNYRRAKTQRNQSDALSERRYDVLRPICAIRPVRWFGIAVGRRGDDGLGVTENITDQKNADCRARHKSIRPCIPCGVLGESKSEKEYHAANEQNWPVALKRVGERIAQLAHEGFLRGRILNCAEAQRNAFRAAEPAEFCGLPIDRPRAHTKVA